MVKFGKNKFKALNKLAKKQSASAGSVSNKVIKKKINAEKKVSFQKEVLLKEAASGHSNLVKSVPSDSLLQKLSKKPAEPKKHPEDMQKQKVKPVEKKNKRRKTQISDTKLLLKLMKKK